MPQQETFLERSTSEGHVLVVKTYDEAFAREVFRQMEGDAIETLHTSLQLPNNYLPEDIPSTNDPDYVDFLWEALLEQAREDGALNSFFVVLKRLHLQDQYLLVTPDWPTAELYAASL
jgi:hypothetical protein